MRAVFEWLPNRGWGVSFHKMSDEIRDLGDYIVFLGKLQVNIWVKKPYWNKFYKRKMLEESER